MLTTLARFLKQLEAKEPQPPRRGPPPGATLKTYRLGCRRKPRCPGLVGQTIQAHSHQEARELLTVKGIRCPVCQYRPEAFAT